MSCMIELPKEKTKPKDQLEQYLQLYFGLVKIGKSAIAAEFPDALFLATEPGHDALEIFKIDINEWSDFDKVLAKLQDGNHGFKTIVIDTVDNAFKLCKKAIESEKKIEHLSDAGWGKGYDLVDTKFQTVINEFTKLGLGIIFISHLDYKEILKPSGDSYTLSHTTMDKRCAKFINGLVSLIFFFTMEGNKRVIYTQPQAEVHAGCRITLPAKIELGKNPKEGYHNIVSAFYGRNGDADKAKETIVNKVLQAEGILAKEKIDKFETETRKINSRKKHLNTEDIMKATIENLQKYLQHLGQKYKTAKGGNE